MFGTDALEFEVLALSSSKLRLSGWCWVDAYKIPGMEGSLEKLSSEKWWEAFLEALKAALLHFPRIKMPFIVHFEFWIFWIWLLMHFKSWTSRGLVTICTREAEQRELSDLADSRAPWAYHFSWKTKSLQVASRLQACCIIFIYISWPSVLYTSSIAFPDCCQRYAFCQSEKGFSNIWDEVADSMTDREMMAGAQHDRMTEWVAFISLS